MREKFPLHRAGERVKGAILFRKREWPLWNPKRKAFDWQFLARMTFAPPERECLRAALPRWVLLYDLICSYHPLPLCQSRSGVAESPSTGTLLNAASEAMPLFRTQSAAEQTSLAPHDSKARLQSVTTRRRFMAKPCTPHLHCAARAVIQTANSQCAGSRGKAPRPFLLGGVRGDVLFPRKENIPPCRIPTRCGAITT